MAAPRLLYMGAGTSDPLGINASSVQELGSRAKYSAAAAETDDRMISQLTILDEQLGIQEKDLQKQKSEAEKHQSDADNARRQVEAANSKLQHLLSTTKSDIKTLANRIEQDRLVAQAKAEKARVDAAAAAQAAAAQAAAAQAGNNSGGGRSFSSNPSDIGTAPANLPAPSGGAAAAIAFARAQIGKPYRYAGTGPGSFDCSGLTMMAWAQGGVGMSHGSQSQWASFPKVPITQLQPGDLVFFGSSGPSNHHDGLYIGGGTMIEAPHTGAFVRYASIYRPDLVSTGSRP